jgi:uncharacterized cupredoxin-like copper-binding protein
VQYRKTFMRLIGAGMVLGLLAGCAGQGMQDDSMSVGPEKAKQAVAQAEKAVEKTRSKTNDWGTWKSVLGIMGNAQKSLDQGDYTAAYQAAQEAKWQAKMGLQQYKEQQKVWEMAVKTAKENGDFPEQQFVSGSGGQG